MVQDAHDTAKQMLELVAEHSKLKCPAGGYYAWEAGCLHSIIGSFARECPQFLPLIKREIEWHQKQVTFLKTAKQA
jgi:hypothetical protein